jgi:hypothetical protein
VIDKPRSVNDGSVTYPTLRVRTRQARVLCALVNRHVMECAFLKKNTHVMYVTLMSKITLEANRKSRTIFHVRNPNARLREGTILL